MSDRTKPSSRRNRPNSKFIKAFRLETESGSPLKPDIPTADGVPVRLTQGNRIRWTCTWDLEFLPDPVNDSSGASDLQQSPNPSKKRANEEFNLRLGNATQNSSNEWKDLFLGSSAKWFSAMLYKYNDYEHTDRIYGHGADNRYSRYDNASSCEYIIAVELDISWGAKFFRDKGYLPIEYLRAVYQYIRECSEDVELHDSESEVPTPDPPHFQLNLYDYQSRTLTWMRRIESGELRIRYYKEYYHGLIDPEDPSGAAADPFCYVSSRDVDETAKTMAFYQCYTEPPHHFREFPIHGGLLADIMGNGKTVTGIAHICSQKAFNGYNTFPTLDQGMERDIYIPSRATLVLCPNNILDQWYNEFSKCLGSALGTHFRVFKVGNMREFKALSHWDLINADVIIASYGLMSNNTHVGRGFVQQYGLSKQFTEHRSAKRMIPELTLGESPETWAASVYEELETLLPSKRLYLYKWHRIIHDEFHEVINVKTRTNCLLLLIHAALRAQYYWGFSGTPILEHKTVLDNLPHLLRFQDDWGEILPMTNGNKQLFFEKCVIKNTKRNLPPLKYHTVNIEGTAKEKQLYETQKAASGGNTEQLVRFACYHNLGIGSMANAARSLLSAESVMEEQATKRKQQIAKLDNLLNDTEICLRSHEASLKVLSSLPKYDFTKNWKRPEDLYFLCSSADKQHTAKVRVALENDLSLQRARDLVREYRKEVKNLEKLKAQKADLERANALHQKFKENRTMSCPVCGEEGPCDAFLSLPTCRHAACVGCMDLMRLGAQKFCPICRAVPFDGERLAKLVGDTGELEAQNLSTSGLNIGLWGSKICAIVDAMKALKPDDKVLVFAEWSDLLDQLRVAMKEVGIDSATVEGTTASRSAAIRRFQTDPKCQAILLSSVHGTSGINLTEGNHVFLVHHFLGSSGKEYEYQAICRAYRTGQQREVTVTHFIREDTLEKALHEKRGTLQDLYSSSTNAGTSVNNANANATSTSSSHRTIVKPGKRLTILPTITLKKQDGAPSQMIQPEQMQPASTAPTITLKTPLKLPVLPILPRLNPVAKSRD